MKDEQMFSVLFWIIINGISHF